ncbi:TPA: DUF4489 domain-containing protein [Clostridium perfringens]|uniref:DUF4489 domain-containing protein n=1 Tax=Clostridium TaxID=1485 RepID=UPI00077646D1|nr:MULTISPECIES: DUF4489 domain-containing protein [Clostridium]EGT0015225.1 DUF4489 domain-containing protein [Clostridium perfringens]EGT3605293.1 DUF4489 domain-containing protein [Clostridium perfringens]EGT4138664.1 DUF4489 domain-containing protein [Clostridium perfringens]EGT4145256.1 DUF4489 domain-containing protein [Clostridium perfringens]EIW6613329.1 DUF4489 domain-containing protein [Clostridium perfringens]
MKMIQEKNNCYDNCETKEIMANSYNDCCEYKCEPPKKVCCECCECCECKCEPPKKVCCEKCYVVEKKVNCAPEPGRAILRCGRGSAGPFPILNLGVIFGESNAIEVGSVNIDTTNLCNPSILLNVTITLNAPVAILSTLTFSIIKCCNGCSQPVGDSFTFSSPLEALSSQSFSFQACDTSNCCECVTYKLKITNATLAAAGLSLTANMSALAVENLC